VNSFLFDVIGSYSTELITFVTSSFLFAANAAGFAALWQLMRNWVVYSSSSSDISLVSN